MLSLKIAFRYLKAKKTHTAVNVIALIALIGIAVATMAMVLLLSIFNGFTDLAAGQLSVLDPELAVVRADGRAIVNGDSLAQALAADSDVAAAVPVLTGRGMLIADAVQVPVMFKGVPDGYDSVSRIAQVMLVGEYAEYAGDGIGAVQVGVGVANKLQMAPGAVTRMHLYVPRRRGRVNPANPSAAFRGSEVALSGVFSVNNPDIDTDNIIVPIEVARDVMDYDTEATQIEVTAAPGADIEQLKQQLSDAMGSDYRVLTRLEQRRDAFRMISIEKWVTFMMLVCILVIALFNVVSTLSLMAIEKRDNMVTLRALGAGPRLVRNVFIAEGFLITVIGGAIGLIVGLLLALAQQYFHFVGLSADASTLTVDYYPVRVEVGDVAVVAVVVLVLAVLVGAIARLIVKRQ